jgi:hypothetical protein
MELPIKKAFSGYHKKIRIPNVLYSTFVPKEKSRGDCQFFRNA